MSDLGPESADCNWFSLVLMVHFLQHLHNMIQEVIMPNISVSTYNFLYVWILVIITEDLEASCIGHVSETQLR